MRCPICRQAFRAPPAENRQSLRERLLEEVRQMRARDSAPAAPVEVQGYELVASDSQTRDSEVAVPRSPSVPAEAQGYELAASDSQMPNSGLALAPQSVRQAPPKELAPETAEDYQILPEELELARLGPTRRRNTDPGRGDYPRVQLGLTLNLAAASILLGMFILVLIILLCSSKTIYAATEQGYGLGPAADTSERPPIVTICFVLVAIIGEGLHIAGLGFCLGAPRKDAARTFALIALLTASAGLALLCSAGVLGLAGRFGIGGLVVLILGLIVTLSGKGLYLLFVRALGLAMEKVWLGRQVYGTIALIGAAAVFHLLVLAGAGFGLTGGVASVVTGIGLGEGLREVTVSALFFWLGSLLILLYAFIRIVITINDARNEVIYHLMRR